MAALECGIGSLLRRRNQNSGQKNTSSHEFASAICVPFLPFWSTLVCSFESHSNLNRIISMKHIIAICVLLALACVACSDNGSCVALIRRPHAHECTALCRCTHTLSKFALSASLVPASMPQTSSSSMPAASSPDMAPQSPSMTSPSSQPSTVPQSTPSTAPLSSQPGATEQPQPQVEALRGGVGVGGRGGIGGFGRGFV